MVATHPHEGMNFEAKKMEMLVDGLLYKPLVTLAVAAFMSGVALFYLVMQRTRKHRLQQMEENQGISQPE